MKVVYLGRTSRRTTPEPAIDGDVIELLSNNWNDYGYKTSFPVTCRINDEAVDLPMIKLLVDEHITSEAALDVFRHEGWDGHFPIPDANYISIPTDITFYEQVESLLGLNTTIEIARALRDASYLVYIAEDAAASLMTSSDGFKNSLQRERGSIKAYMDGWRIFAKEDISVRNLEFRFTNIYNNIKTLNIKFQSNSRLPHDLNVLIGPNGYGKSQVLHQIVSDWIAPAGDDGVGFAQKPNLSQLVVVSYSPFEKFPVDLANKVLQDKEAYRYFGLRGRASSSDQDKLGRTGISREFPKRDSAHSLVACLRDDKKFRLINGWAQKVSTVERVLLSAIDFDFAAVEVSTPRPSRLYTDISLIENPSVSVGKGEERRLFVPIAPDRIEELDDKALSKVLIPNSGVIFFKGGDQVKLSSGQRLFAYIVINILGAIRRNSLILVDEPELFLHPTLEIQFIEMLKTILASFHSKALLATHSVVTVREMPSDCVHVFEKTNDDLVVNSPPFQTFGGDFQRISSYVFGDKSVSKPFERWIQNQLEDMDAEELIEELGDDLNEELIVQIRAMGRGQW